MKLLVNEKGSEGTLVLVHEIVVVLGGTETMLRESEAIFFRKIGACNSETEEEA